MRTSIRSLAVAFSLLLLAACAGGLTGSQAGATIEGTVSGAQALTVAVPGTSVRTTASQSGAFVLLNVPAGTTALRFTGVSTDATLPIAAVVQSEHRSLTVTVSGSDAHEEQEQTATEFRGKVDAVAPALTVAGRTVTTTATTVFKRGDTSITLADIKVGDEVEVHGALQADGSVLASEIEDGVSADEGGVAFVAELTTITDATHLSVGGIPVVLSSATDIRRGDTKIAAADLHVHDRLLVKGTLLSGVTVSASAIRVLVPDHDIEVHVAGPLAAISTTDHTLTIGSTTIAYDGSTEFDGEGGLKSAADLKVGDPLMVEAARRADGSLLAREIHRVPPQPPPGTELHGPIAAIAADGKSFTVDGKSVAVGAETHFGGEGDPKSLADFKVGDSVVLRAKALADGSLLALAVYRKPAGGPPPPGSTELEGAITAIAADRSSITVGDHAVLVDATTSFGGDGSPKSVADLKIGDRVEVKAEAHADGSLHALGIFREPPHPPQPPGDLEVKGAIELLGTDGLTVMGHRFAVDAATVIHIGDKAAALSDLKVGQVVEVRGKARAGLPPLATEIRAEP